MCAEVTGRLTEMKTRSASLMAESMSVEKNKFLPLHDSTTSFRPGWDGEGVEKWDKEGVSLNVKDKLGRISDKWVLHDALLLLHQSWCNTSLLVVCSWEVATLSKLELIYIPFSLQLDAGVGWAGVGWLPSNSFSMLSLANEINPIFKISG